MIHVICEHCYSVVLNSWYLRINIIASAQIHTLRPTQQILSCVYGYGCSDMLVVNMSDWCVCWWLQWHADCKQVRVVCVKQAYYIYWNSFKLIQNLTKEDELAICNDWCHNAMIFCSILFIAYKSNKSQEYHLPYNSLHTSYKHKHHCNFHSPSSRII